MSCLDAKSLMVGDWVIVKPSMLPIKVAAIHPKKVGYHATNKLYWVRMDLLEPIPLTPQILRKNGFAEINNNEKWFKIQLSENDFIGLENFEENHWTLGAVVFPNLIPHLSINYVHELQHALRLCGIDKEIEL